MTQGEMVGTLIWLHGYTHGEVAKRLGISRGHISNVVNNIDPLTEELAQPLASVLGVVPGRLLELKKGRPMRKPRAPKKPPRRKKREKKTRPKAKRKAQ